MSTSPTVASPISTLAQIARDNFVAMSDNQYVGRAFVVGLDATGENLMQLYWLMGRSTSSRKRVLSFDSDGRLFTELVDPTVEVVNRDLILYNAMQEKAGFYVVSNGSQTDSYLQRYRDGFELADALRGVEYEPDKPNYTPRITSIFCPGQQNRPLLEIALLRKSPFGKSCQGSFWQYQELAPGFGYGLTTYEEDGDPLPSFQGEPLLMPLDRSPDEELAAYWGMLNADNRVAIALKVISLQTGRSTIRVINRFEKLVQQAPEAAGAALLA